MDLPKKTVIKIKWDNVVKYLAEYRHKILKITDIDNGMLQWINSTTNPNAMMAKD